jgi:phosphoserine aminotransferase
MKPTEKPRRPHFSSGPCAKRPGWSPELLAGAELARSHRSAPAKAKLEAAIDGTRRLLRIPDSHRIGIVPASDTGAVELALWSLLGARGVDVLAWESFGHGWVTDIVKQLGLEDVRVLTADYGALPDLATVDFDRDVVFCWNGTTSGVRVPDGEWIADARQGLTIADATSAAFAIDLPWEKLDVATFSWQKVLGGEAQHGMLALGPRAVERLESHTPAWPLPKIFRLTKGGKLNQGIFEGATINTPSMLVVEDYLDALRWAEGIGGLDALMARTEASLARIGEWVAATPWVDFLARTAASRSPTSVCLAVVDPWFTALEESAQRATIEEIAAKLEAEAVALDIAGYRDAPPGLRIWCGATVESEDVRALLPWLDWAFAEVKASFRPAA